jgi:DNA primase
LLVNLNISASVIPKETIDKIFDAARIEEVVGDFLPLKKRGVNMIGLCPFHNEKTPSFTVSPAKGIYKCFGCGEAGNSVNFVMKHENMTYPEALKYLAAKYGIEVEEKEVTDEDKRKEAERESLMGVTAFAQNYFTDVLLNHPEGKAIGLQYFNERGFNDYIIQKFNLGYAVDSWDDFQKAAKEKGYSEEALVKTGLVVKTDEGKVYDRFRGRVIFPIHNISGRPIGFGGRILDSSKSKAKYVNSPESEIYHKSDVLYGIHLARTAMIKAGNCYLVEGYTDVISLHKAGIENVVASSGTSLTTGQIKLIKRYTNQITILYDGDAAGIKASFRGIDMIIEEGLTVKIVLFPEGEDPDSFARNHSAAEVEEFINKEAKDFILFKSDMLKDEAGNDPTKKAAMIKDIVQSISLVPENIDRLLYTREASEIVDVDEQILIDEINKFRRKKYYKERKKQEEAPPPPEFSESKAQPQMLLQDNTVLFEKEIVRVLLNYGSLSFNPKLSGLTRITDGIEEEEISVSDFIIGSLENDEVELSKDENLKKIFEEYKTAWETGNVPTQQFFIKHTDDNLRNTAIDLITRPYELHDWESVKIFVNDETNERVFPNTILKPLFYYKLKLLKQKREEVMDKLKDENLTPEEIEAVQKKIKSIDKLKNIIAADFGIAVLW